MRKYLTFGASLLIAGALGLGAAVASNSNATQKGNLRHGALPFCNLAYFTIGDDSASSFSLRYRSRHDDLTGKVKLKDAEPNTVYQVRLIQGFFDCFQTDAYITTNRHGRGSATIREDSHSFRAVLFVCEAPCFIWSDRYASFPLFNHSNTLLADPAPAGAKPTDG